jgi:hypothetical protein
MSEAEIVRRYKDWPDKPKHAVQGLADLNGCDKYTIVEILYKNGAINKASVSAYIRNGKCPASLRALFNENVDKTAASVQDETEQTAAPMKVEEPVPVRAELPYTLQCLISKRLDELESEYKSAKQIVTEYESLTEYLKHGVPVQGVATI